MESWHTLIRGKPRAIKAYLIMPYTIEEHHHRFAAWAASSSASASPLCRFKVSAGVAILEKSGFIPSFSVLASCLYPLP